MKNSISSPYFYRFNRLRPPKTTMSSIRNILLAGGILMYPTDTCYALSCIATDQGAVEKIYRIKKRPLGKHLSIAFSDLAMLESYASLTHEIRSFFKQHGPERVTLLVHQKTESAGCLGKLTAADLLGARIPKDLFTRKLIQSVGLPLVTTSANISGGVEVYTSKDIYHFLSHVDELPDAVMFATLSKNSPSSVYDTNQQPWKMLRQGTFTL